jgi:hypothetical protein
MERLLQVRLSEADSDALKAAADEQRITLSALVRIAVFQHPMVARHLVPLARRTRARTRSATEKAA